MLLQTNSYIVPEDRRAEHARLIRRFRQALLRIGCDQFEVYEQVGANWSPGGSGGRFVQIMRFQDRQHQQAVQVAERNDPGAQHIIAEFCDLINFPYQQQHGYFSTGFYVGLLPNPPRQTFGYEEDAAGAFEAGDEAFAEPEAQAEEQTAVEEIAPEFGEAQEETAPQPDEEAELDHEATVEVEAGPAFERIAEAPADEETRAAPAASEIAEPEPSPEEAEADALADVETSPQPAVSVEAIVEPSALQSSNQVEIPAEVFDEFEFDQGESGAEDPNSPALEQPASEPALPGETSQAAEATALAPEAAPEDAAAALISFLDSLTQEDLAADESVAGEVDAEGHLRAVDPSAAAEPSFADDTIAPPALEPDAMELVTADEFAPPESTSIETTEPESELEPEFLEEAAASETDPAGDEYPSTFAEEEPAPETAPESVTAPASETAPPEQLPAALTLATDDEVGSDFDLESGESAAQTASHVAPEPESFSTFHDETRTVSNAHDASQPSEAHPAPPDSLDPIFGDPDLLNASPGSMEQHSDALHAQHEAHEPHEPGSGEHDALAQGHEQGAELDNAVEFESFMRELEGPSADPARR